MAMQAKDTFVADMADGSTKRVVRGEVLPDNHELVRLDKAGALFAPLNLDEPAGQDVPAPKRMVRRTAQKGM